MSRDMTEHKCTRLSNFLNYPELRVDNIFFLSLGQFYWFFGWQLLLPVNDINILRMTRLA